MEKSTKYLNNIRLLHREKCKGLQKVVEIGGDVQWIFMKRKVKRSIRSVVELLLNNPGGPLCALNTFQ